MVDPDRDHRTDLPVDPSAASCGYAASQCGSHWNPALVLRSIPRILTGIHQINVVCISLYRTIMYAGCRLFGLSGVKKLANGNFIIPDKRLFAAAGKIGKVITRGETRTLQETDINNEQIHIKVSGYSFGSVITDISKAAKVVYAK